MLLSTTYIVQSQRRRVIYAAGTRTRYSLRGEIRVERDLQQEVIVAGDG